MNEENFKTGKMDGIRKTVQEKTFKFSDKSFISNEKRQKNNKRSKCPILGTKFVCGWTICEFKRRNPRTSSGFTRFKIYTSPNGEKLRSRVAVMKWFKKNSKEFGKIPAKLKEEI